jgi:predicted ferric reductase
MSLIELQNMKKQTLWLSFLLVNLFIIGGFWFSISQTTLFSSTDAIFIALGSLTGLLAAYFILIQFFFVGRNPWIEGTFGLDTLTRIHQKAGKLGIFLLLLHPIFLTIGYAHMGNVSFWKQYVDLVFRSGDDITQAAIGLLLFVVVVITSITFARKHVRYETWYFVHLTAYLAVMFSFGHQMEFGTTINANTLFYGYWLALYIAVFGSHVLYRFIRPFSTYQRHRFVVNRVVPENYNCFSIYIGGQNIDKFTIAAGQFMILRFLQKEFWWQAHPFSLSYAPGKNEIRITMKSVGDFTTELPKLLKPGTPVLIDGPYGVFTAQKIVKNKILFIAGGIGITPIRSLMESLLQSGKEMVLVYGNRKEQDIVFGAELQNIVGNTHAKIINVLSDDQAFAGEKGIVDLERIKRLVPDAVDRDVFVCGPPPMMNGVVSALQKLGVPASRIHFEKFAF